MSTYLSEKVRIADREYDCYGCDGELKIGNGEKYLEIRIRENGKIVRRKLCIRCWIAFWNKNLFSEGSKCFDGKGCLKFNRLSSAFRKEWNAMARELHALPEDKRETEGIEIQKRHMDRLCPPDKIKALNQAKEEHERQRQEQAEKKRIERLERLAKANTRNGKKNATESLKTLVLDLIELKTMSYKLGVNAQLSDLLDRLAKDREGIADGLKLICK